MSVITTATRMWLLKSFKPFKFTNEFDKTLNYSDEENLGLYIHIPFCRKICSFCPYCKELYQSETCEKYIDYLIKEINMVGYKKKVVTSLYFGGGTPTLALYRLKEIIDTVNKYFIIQEGIGIELHPEDVTKENLDLLKSIGITKISIGIQSFQDKFLQILGRTKIDYEKMFEVIN